LNLSSEMDGGPFSGDSGERVSLILTMLRGCFETSSLAP
jgi:hypothetical protein